MQGLVGDAESGVGDLDAEPVRFAAPAAHSHRAPGRELHRVAGQVHQKLPQTRGIRPHFQRREVDPQGNAARVHTGREHAAKAVRDLG